MRPQHSELPKHGSPCARQQLRGRPADGQASPSQHAGSRRPPQTSPNVPQLECRHRPPAQTAPSQHATVALHVVSPHAAPPHEPRKQTAWSQTTSQPPQLRASVPVLTQVPPQHSRLPVHAVPVEQHAWSVPPHGGSGMQYSPRQV
jgi:hypothetical protein